MTAIEMLGRPQAYALTVDDYVMLSEAGAFADFAKTELIEGVIFPVNAQYLGHSRAQRHFFLELNAACDRLGQGLEAFFELSARINRHSMPRPDVLVSRDAPARGPIEPAQVMLVVEISDTTHDVDLDLKPPVYAHAGVSEYWVVDLKAQLVHVMWSPNPDGYGETDKVRFGDPVVARTLDGIEVQTATLLT